MDHSLTSQNQTVHGQSVHQHDELQSWKWNWKPGKPCIMQSMLRAQQGNALMGYFEKCYHTHVCDGIEVVLLTKLQTTMN